MKLNEKRTKGGEAFGRHFPEALLCRADRTIHRTVFLSLNIICQWISIYPSVNDNDLTFKWLEKLSEDTNKKVWYAHPSEYRAAQPVHQTPH